MATHGLSRGPIGFLREEDLVMGAVGLERRAPPVADPGGDANVGFGGGREQADEAVIDSC